MTCRFKIDIRNLINCDLSTGKSQNFHLNGFLLSTVYIVLAKKVQRSYLSWNWRGIENLERNLGEESSYRKEFDKFWPEHSKVSTISTLMGSFWEKYILFELKSTDELSFMKLKRDTKFGEELTYRFKIDIKNFTNFDVSAQKSQKFSL